jgi:hypothetical protein
LRTEQRHTQTPDGRTVLARTQHQRLARIAIGERRSNVPFGQRRLGLSHLTHDFTVMPVEYVQHGVKFSPSTEPRLPFAG